MTRKGALKAVRRLFGTDRRQTAFAVHAPGQSREVVVGLRYSRRDGSRAIHGALGWGRSWAQAVGMAARRRGEAES